MHLNPARAKLLSPEQPLRDFPWSSWPDYLKPATERPRWLRVDRLLGEYHIPQDSDAGREHLEQCLELRRAAEAAADYKSIRRGWCLGGETFRQELLEGVHTRVTESHHAATRRETTEEKARRILNEELDKLGWTRADLAQRAKGEVRKIWIARRLRAETAVTLKWIAAELHMGTWTYVSNLLVQPSEPINQANLNLCQ